MRKSTIIEAQNSQTVYEEGKSNNGILGHLKGVFADYKNGTRNSDRLYTEELWDNRVFGSEDVMEALETKTLFGELDHPEGDRCETLAKNAAISITKLEKRPDEGVIYGEAEILDTPTGRIVKALADSGAKLGISSRGMGEEIYVDGQNIIDPDTYDFITFDVVVTPANTKARVSLTESKQLNKLTENFKREIAESETENQLNQLKTVVETVNMSNKDELVNLIESKLDTITKPTVANTKLTEANRQLALELIKKKYEEAKFLLDEQSKATESLSDENAKLIEDKEFLSTSRETLKAKIKENNAKIKELEESNNKMLEEKKSLEENRVLDENKNREILLRNNQLNNKKVENINRQNDISIKELQESLSKKDEEIAKLTEAKADSDRKVSEYSKVLVENKKLLDKVKSLQESNNKLVDSNKKLTESANISQKKLQESKLLENKRIAELTKQVQDLTNKNKKMEEAQDRFSKLSFNPIGTVKAVAENFQNSADDYDSDDIELYNALTGK